MVRWRPESELGHVITQPRIQPIALYCTRTVHVIFQFPVAAKPDASGLPEAVHPASVEHVVVDRYVLHALQLVVALFYIGNLQFYKLYGVPWT